MLMLANTTDKLQLITSGTSAIDVLVNWGDYSDPTVTLGRTGTAIVTAATTDITPAPDASTVRKIKSLTARNKGSANNTVTVVYNANGTSYQMYSTNLKPEEVLQYNEGFGFFKSSDAISDIASNSSVADQAIGASVTNYITGSDILLPRTPKVGTFLEWDVLVGKSGAATATESWLIKFGTAGAVGDTTRLTFVGDTETAVADEAWVKIFANIRGPIGASCIVQGGWIMNDNLTTTGFSNTARKAQVRPITSGAFDITPTGTIVGLALTTGASHAITVRLVQAKALKL